MKKYKFLKISKTKKLRYISNYFKKNLYLIFLPGFASNIVGKKPNTLRKQRSVGKNFIPYHKIGGRVRYNKLEVQEYLDNRLRRSAND